VPKERRVVRSTSEFYSRRKGRGGGPASSRVEGAKSHYKGVHIRLDQVIKFCSYSMTMQCSGLVKVFQASIRGPNLVQTVFRFSLHGCIVRHGIAVHASFFACA
jgi:hypothetical protein